jgi:scyllo-inositol 2-dehydrogenase (NADP+)
MAYQLPNVRAAIIGYGGAFNMGKQHGDAIVGAGMTVVAACDADAKRVAVAAQDYPGIRTYTDYHELLKDPEVDLVIVILPHNLHAPVAIAAANAGKHVVVEKPMCNSVEEADAMISAADGAGTMLSVFHNRRWDGDYRTILATIQKGTIGEVFHIEACMSGYHGPNNWWRDDKKISGGAMFDWGAHIIDWILHLVPQSVSGVDGYFHKLVWFENKTNEDHCELVIRFEGGPTAQVEISSIAAVGKSRWRILGTKGAIEMPSWDKIFVSGLIDGNIAKYEAQIAKSDWHAYYHNIAGHLMRGEDLVVKPTEARRIIAIIEAAEHSSTAKRTTQPAYR